MKTRFITSIFIVLASVIAIISKLLPYNIGDYIFDVFVIAITLVASFEICNIMEKSGKRVNKYFSCFYPIVNYIVMLFYMNRVSFSMLLIIEFIVLLLYFVLVFVFEIIKNSNSQSKENSVKAANTILCCVYPCLLFMLLIAINHMDIYAGKYFSLMFITLIFAITWLTDTMAYLVGRTLKGPKLAPTISPNKTISGAIGGLIGGMGGAMLVFLVMTQVPALTALLDMHSLAWWHFLLIGAVCSALGQTGDLFESKLKRNANIKDSGSIFPGHGGMLDRVDAMIFVTTIMFIIVSLILI